MQSIMSNGQCGQSILLSFDLETYSDNFTLLFCSAGHLKKQLSAGLSNQEACHSDMFSLPQDRYKYGSTQNYKLKLLSKIFLQDDIFCI